MIVLLLTPLAALVLRSFTGDGGLTTPLLRPARHQPAQIGAVRPAD